MEECSNCYDYSLSDGEWYCQYCGSLRNDCARSACRGSIVDRACNKCGTAPKAPCEDCGEWIPADSPRCDECGRDMREAKSMGWLGVLGLPIIVIGAVMILIGVNVFPIWFSIFTFIPLGLATLLLGTVLTGTLTIGGLIGEKVSNTEYAASLSMGEEANKTEEWTQLQRQRREESLETVKSALDTAVDIGESYTERKRERELEKEKQQIEAFRRANDEELREARNAKFTTVLWSMNCPKCGLTWATTQKSNVIRSDKFNKIGFSIVNNTEYKFIQDTVRIQCRAPDCNHTESFTKDSLW